MDKRSLQKPVKDTHVLVDDVWMSIGIVVSEDEYDELSSIARNNGWTIQGLLGPMLREAAKKIIKDN